MRYKYLRFLVKFRKFKSFTFSKVFGKIPEINSFEEKVIKIWKVLVKDKNSKLSYNSLDVRHVENDNLFMIIEPGSMNECYITLMDIEKRKLYEIRIPEKHASNVKNIFDYEIISRMRKIEGNRRSIIESDIDIILDEQLKKVTH